MTKLPQRSKRFGVGKEIGGAVYVHRQYADRLGPAVAEAREVVPGNFDYTVVKYNYREGTVTFIVCRDFDTAPEPTVGDTLTVRPDGTTTLRRQPADPYIYHHKWLFVADDYTGFDVEQNKKRSLAWLDMPHIDSRRIGRQSYWETNVLPKLRQSKEFD